MEGEARQGDDKDSLRKGGDEQIGDGGGSRNAIWGAWKLGKKLNPLFPKINQLFILQTSTTLLTGFLTKKPFSAFLKGHCHSALWSPSSARDMRQVTQTVLGLEKGTFAESGRHGSQSCLDDSELDCPEHQ